VSAPPVIARDAQANPEEPCRRLRSFDEIGQAPMHDQEDILHRVVEVRRRDAEPPERSPDESNMLLVDLLKNHSGCRDPPSA
jgi:hypothetical protein